MSSVAGTMALTAAISGGGEGLTATFLGGREDLNPGRTEVAYGNYFGTTFTTPASLSTNMPSGTSLIVVVQTFEKIRALYGGPNNDITDSDGNTWTRVAGVFNNTSSETEVRVAVCELSSLPSSFTLHYDSGRDRSANSAWYALQNYSSTTSVSTDTTTGIFTSTAGSTTVTTQPGDVVITGSIEDSDPTALITGSASMTSDFDTDARGGNSGGVQVSVVSEIATGTSVTHTLPTDATRQGATMLSVVFR